MIETEATISLELGGGKYGGLAGLVKGEIQLSDVKVVFSHGFCSKHERQFSHNESCVDCENEIRRVALSEIEHLRADLAREVGLADSRPGYIDCSNLYHSHSCDCHLGHRCEGGCRVYDRAVQEGEQLPHALYQLADEAGSSPTASLHARLFKLEQENTLLRGKLEETLQLVRELHEAARGAPSVQAS